MSAGPATAARCVTVPRLLPKSMTERGTLASSFPKPQGALAWFLYGILGLWVVIGVLVNWAGTGDQLLMYLVLDRDAFLHGQLWRLVTAPFVHLVTGREAVNHVVSNLLLIYFFGASLQETWGSRRLAGFLLAAAFVGEALQLGLDLAIPASFAPMMHTPVTLGSKAMGTAALFAWALANPTRQVMLFFVLPLSANAILALTIILYVLSVVAIGAPPEGLFAPLGGMAVGYLLGAGSPSPLRRAWLRFRLGKLAAAKKEQQKLPPLKRRPGAPALRVIRGDRDDDDGPSSDSGPRYLN